ncbi:DUF6318 family protein [Nocardioides sp.]|uniref:DUF6318 family protein n=1 Tax=Nocardioides sp. TaxID=35761 RepID=UPI003783FA3F
MTGTRVVIAVVGALVLGVTACSGSDPEPRVAPPSSTSTSPTTSPSPSAPTMPAAARGTDAASAEAFVRFYWEMVNYAQATGDVAGLRLLGDKCIGCDAAIKFIQSSYEGGGRIIGGVGRPAKFQTVFVTEQGKRWASTEYRVKTTSQRVDRPGEHHDQTYPGGLTDVRMYLEPTNGAWLVRSLVTL